MKFLCFLLTALPLAAQQPGIEPPAPVPGTIPAPPVNPAPAAPPPAAPAPAAEPAKPRLQLTPAKLAVGEQGVLTLRVPDARNLTSFPQIIDADGLNIEYMGTNSQSYSLNGRLMRSMELQYRVEATEAGNHSIPAQTLTIDGKSITTESLEVVVGEGRPLDDALMPQAQLSVSKTEIWEGEEVAINVSVLLHGAIQVTSQPFPVIKSDGVAVSRFDRHGRTEATEVNGQYWNAWRMPSSMVAIKSGELSFGPAEVKLEILVPLSNAQRDPFGSFPSARRSLTVQSNAVKIKVKPLPEEGKPQGFTGLVGKFQINARSDSQVTGPLKVQLGDPVSFEIAITGTGNFDAINAPALENGDGLRPFKPKVSMENRGFGQEFGQKSFTQIIFPEKPGVHAVTFVLPHFDPGTGKYTVAKSTPVELTVTGEIAAAGTADNTAPASDVRDFAAAAKALIPGEELSDILPNAVEGGRWYSTTATLVPVHPLLLHGAPALILALLLGTGAARRLRAWSLAHRPPPNAPRACAEVSRDLQREGLSRLQFYGYVSEYARAWQFWKKAPLPLHPGLAAVLADRDHWLYASNAEPAAAPVPRDEQSRAASVLNSQLSA